MLDERNAPLPEAQLLEWADQVCDALVYMHNQDPPIIHRDIKPANIKITPQGKAILVDFGIAKVLNPGLRTAKGAKAITPGFSPPEQYGIGATDAQSDIYALGATLYYLLTTQKLPDSLDMLAKVAPDSIPIEERNPAVSAHISTVIQKAVQLDRENRWRSMADFRTALMYGRESQKPKSTSVSPIRSEATTTNSYTNSSANSRPTVGRRSYKKVWIGLAALIILIGIFGSIVLGLILSTTNLGKNLFSDPTATFLAALSTARLSTNLSHTDQYLRANH